MPCNDLMYSAFKCLKLSISLEIVCLENDFKLFCCAFEITPLMAVNCSKDGPNIYKPNHVSNISLVKALL